MARLRGEDPAARKERLALPADLTDPLTPWWRTEADVRAWATEHGLRIRPGAVMFDRRSRQRAAASAWARRAGVTSVRKPAFPDWNELRRLGLRLDSPTDPDPRMWLREN